MIKTSGGSYDLLNSFKDCFDFDDWRLYSRVLFGHNSVDINDFTPKSLGNEDKINAESGDNSRSNDDRSGSAHVVEIID